VDPTARAYAILGLRRGCTPEELKATYRQLVKRWHPDRYSMDPAGQAEASARLREINGALRIVADDMIAAKVPRPPVTPAPDRARPHPPEYAPGRPLSRSEIDALVGALRTESPVDTLLQWMILVGPFAALWLLLLPTRGPSIGEGVLALALLILGISGIIRRLLRWWRESRNA
jgi:DnaJ domain